MHIINMITFPIISMHFYVITNCVRNTRLFTFLLFSSRLKSTKEIALQQYTERLFKVV